MQVTQYIDNKEVAQKLKNTNYKVFSTVIKRYKFLDYVDQWGRCAVQKLTRHLPTWESAILALFDDIDNSAMVLLNVYESSASVTLKFDDPNIETISILYTEINRS